MRLPIIIIAAVLSVFLVAPAFSQSILVCDKDHDLLFHDPEGAGNVTATYGITKALDDNGYAYTKVAGIPTDLSPYDIVFLVMGALC